MSAASALLGGRRSNRWVQLAAGIVGMVMIANLEYSWTLFVDPIQHRFGWSETAIQVAFTVFTLMETWLAPGEGYLADRFGPGRLVAVGGLLVGVSWTLNALADSLPLLYAGQALGGMGTGIVYGTIVGNALKWFPDHRGLAAGLTAAGFGAGAALTLIPISQTIQTSGYQTAFLHFGLFQGASLLLVALGLRAPRRGEAPAGSTRVMQTAHTCTPGQTVRTHAFWLLYLMFTLVATGGLMIVASIAPIAEEVGVAHVPVSFLGITLAALPFGMALDRVTNGVTRPLFGWISDHLGRDTTMGLAFAGEAIGIFLLTRFAHEPILFVLLTGMVFFAWGEIYSLFPSICTDLFGATFATTNYGLLYTAKGTASLMVPIGSAIAIASGSWLTIFTVAIGFDICASLLAFLVLKPLVRRAIAATPTLAPLADSVPAG